ncbi:MAG: hypothetical protein WBA13_18165 [Microcoleaceae cyanobacterium]
MDNNSEWETVYNQYHRSDDTPLSPITIYPPLNRHTIEILVFADSIPKNWYTAGQLYCYLQNPNIAPFPRTTAIERVPVNVAQVFRFPQDSEYIWLQYHPRRWYKWQTVTVKSWIYG